MMKTLRSRLISTAAAGVLAAMALNASAQSTTEVTARTLGTPEQITVNFADINLHTPQGQKALLARISRAAEKVCGVRDLRKTGGVYQRASRNAGCYEESLSRAMSRINNAAVASTN
jgi:UrcA family protein